MTTDARSDDADANAEALRLRWRFDDIEFDESSQELRRAGTLVELEPKPRELLSFLLRRVGEVVTREEILEELWPDRVVIDAVVTNCVAKLRVALGDQGQRMIGTVKRFGYRLVADVHCERIDPRPLPLADTLALHADMPVPLRPDWTLVRPLSSGAQGVVWLARENATGQQWVFKFARDSRDLSSLKREVTLFRVLSESLGPSAPFVRLMDWNLETAPYFLAAEYSPLGNLEEWARAQGGVAALPLELRLELVAQCAVAVASAHYAGVLHKDIKPANIIVVTDAQGQPQIKLCDLASGHALAQASMRQLGITMLGLTRTVMHADLTGTPMYLAPEVLAGQPSTIASDVYSLGILLLQMVIGDLQRLPTPGWESEIADPLLVEDIALAAAGDSRRRLSDAGQLAVRLRSLASRRNEWQTRVSNAQAADARRQAHDRANARRGLLAALAALGTLAVFSSAWLYVETAQQRADALCSETQGPAGT